MRTLPTILVCIFIFSILRCHTTSSIRQASTTNKADEDKNERKDLDRYSTNLSDTISARPELLQLVGKNIKDAEVLFNGKYKLTEQFKDSLNGISSLTNQTCLVDEAVLFFEPKKGIIKNVTDLWAYNPYLHYLSADNVQNLEQGLIGYNKVINVSKSKLNIALPDLLLSNLQEDYFISAIHNNVYITVNNKGPVIVKYGMDVLPSNEIIEHVSYPGISSFLMLNRNSGEVLGRVKDLPYVVTDWANDEIGKYLVYTHLADITNNKDLISENKWKQFLKVIDIHTGSVCFEMSGNWECECSYYNVPNHAIFACYDEFSSNEGSNPNFRFHLINGILYSRDTNESEEYSFTKSKDFEWVKRKDGTILKYYYVKDYKPTPLNCK